MQDFVSFGMEENNSLFIQLSPDQQNVLALRSGQDYSLEETAAHLIRSVNAIQALQFRALSNLQREVGEVNHD